LYTLSYLPLGEQVLDFHSSRRRLPVEMSRRLPGSSGKVATLTPEGMIAFWKILRAEEKGESRLEQTISD
jgi:hypothetical protein